MKRILTPLNFLRVALGGGGGKHLEIIAFFKSRKVIEPSNEGEGDNQ